MAKIRLKTGTPTEVKRTLNRVMNMAVNGQIDSKVANSIIAGCNAVLSAIRTCDQEKKIEELTELLEELTKNEECR